MNFSVVMSVYSNEKPEYLSAAFQSLCDQTRSFAELIVVEDGPISDDLKRVIENFRVRLQIVSIRLSSNEGLAAALNAGMRHCHTDLVARMDGDDICLPDRFEKQITAFERDLSLDIVGSYATEIDENGNRGRIRRMPTTHERIMEDLWTCPLIHPTVMFRRERIIAIGGYDARLRRRQDYELWFRCAMNGLRFSNLDQPLLLYRFNRGTHRKQSIRLAFEQALIGYRGASRLNMAVWKRLACFAPFLRSLLPAPLQHAVYLVLRRLDPRQRSV